MPLEAMWQEEKQKHLDRVHDEHGNIPDDEAEELARDFFMDMIDDLVEHGVLNRKEENETEYIQLHGKAAALITNGLTFPRILSDPEFWMSDADTKLDEVIEIKEQADKEDRELTEEERTKIQAIFRDPDVDETAKSYFGGDYDLQV